MNALLGKVKTPPMTSPISPMGSLEEHHHTINKRGPMLSPENECIKLSWRQSIILMRCVCVGGGGRYEGAAGFHRAETAESGKTET